MLDLISALADQPASDTWSSGLLWGLVAALVSVVGYFWVQAALVETVHDVRDGRADRTIGETYRAVQPQLGAVVLAGILAAIGITIGFILLIVPGLFLLTIWSMLIPVIVLERRSTGEAFTRSREVVPRARLERLRLVIVTFLIVAIASGVIRAVFAPLPDFWTPGSAGWSHTA